MSFIVREADPNTTVVKKCLRLGIEKYGVPNEIYTDNGKDYTAKELEVLFRILPKEELKAELHHLILCDRK